MSILTRLLKSVIRTYSRYGVVGVLDYFMWFAGTQYEKLRIRFEDKFHLFSYQNWILNNEKEIQPILTEPPQASPVATFLILVKHSDDRSNEDLRNTLISIKNQKITNWECILFYSTERFGDNSLVNVWKSDKRVIIKESREIENKDSAIRETLAFVNGKWIIWTRPGDTFSEDLLGHLEPLIGEIVYWDEDRIKNGSRSAPFLKPKWSPELWLSIDVLYSSAIRTEFVNELTITNADKPSVPLIIFNAKKILHIPEILSHCQSSAWNDREELAEHRLNITKFLELKGIKNSDTTLKPNGSFRVTWPVKPEKISIIIPSKNNYALLRNCLHSILQYSPGEDYEIVIVDDSSTEEKLLDYYLELQSPTSNFRIVQGKSPFNYSVACNLGAQAANGAYLLFLNNDTEVLDPNWLHELRLFACLDEIGIVGGKLLFPNRTIQHAGIVLGMEGHASHVFMGAKENINTPYGSINWYRNFSAVTGACMMMRRSLFEKIGGFDEKFSLAFSDIEICLRVIELGYRVVYNPDACLLHFEGKSRGSYIPDNDIQRGYEMFAEVIKKGDPFYNKGLSYAWRIPSLKRPWEQPPTERLEKILRYM